LWQCYSNNFESRKEYPFQNEGLTCVEEIW